MAKKKIYVVTQARMGSTRLPGKILKEILGKPMLVLFLERLAMMESINGIIVATTKEKEDDLVIETAEKFGHGIRTFRGSTEDVLDRYHHASKKYGVDAIVRITSDCPLFDPKVSDAVVREFIRRECDYCCNNLPPRTYPHGLDTEVFSYGALERAWKEAKLPAEREHVTPYIRNNPDKFSIREIRYQRNLGNLRWTVDFPEDFEFAKSIFERLYPSKMGFGMDDVLDVIRKEPALGKINEKYSL